MNNSVRALSVRMSKESLLGKQVFRRRACLKKKQKKTGLGLFLLATKDKIFQNNDNSLNFFYLPKRLC